jgi:hypothetical protein
MEIMDAIQDALGPKIDRAKAISSKPVSQPHASSPGRLRPALLESVFRMTFRASDDQRGRRRLSESGPLVETRQDPTNDLNFSAKECVHDSAQAVPFPVSCDTRGFHKRGDLGRTDPRVRGADPELAAA